MDRLDDTDERILAELAEHARATFAEIGERVNLSAPAVKRRVDRMLDNGVIRGFTTVVDRNAHRLDHRGLRAGVLPRHHRARRAAARLGGHPRGGQRRNGDGTADAILHVLARDMRHLEDGAGTHPLQRRHRTQREHRRAVEHHRPGAGRDGRRATAAQGRRTFRCTDRVRTPDDH